MPRLAVLVKPMTQEFARNTASRAGLGQNRHSQQRTPWFVALATTCVARLARIRFWPQTRLMEESEIGSTLEGNNSAIQLFLSPTQFNALSKLFTSGVPVSYETSGGYFTTEMRSLP